MEDLYIYLQTLGVSGCILVPEDLPKVWSDGVLESERADGIRGGWLQ